LFIAGVVVATVFCLPVSALPDFWIPDGSGRITHDCSEAQPLVICLQGRKVVMQVTAGGVTGVCYTARFYNVQQKQDLPLTKPILFEVGADSSPELRINDRILKIGIPSTATFDCMSMTDSGPAGKLYHVTFSNE